jgi:hypothetical protein
MTVAPADAPHRNEITNSIPQSMFAHHLKVIGMTETCLTRPALFHCKDSWSRNDAVQSLKVIWERSTKMKTDYEYEMASDWV